MWKISQGYMRSIKIIYVLVLKTITLSFKLGSSLDVPDNNLEFHESQYFSEKGKYLPIGFSSLPHFQTINVVYKFFTTT